MLLLSVLESVDSVRDVRISSPGDVVELVELSAGCVVAEVIAEVVVALKFCELVEVGSRLVETVG